MPEPVFREILKKMMKDILGEEGAQDFMDASSHPFSCRCSICLAWWAHMGPEEDGNYGPFTVEEVRCARTAQG